MKSAIIISLAVTIIAIFAFIVIDNSTPITSDYSTYIRVDKMEKIQQSITNAINDVKSHNFEVIGLNITKQKYICPGYVIRCYGRDKNKFISYDD